MKTTSIIAIATIAAYQLCIANTQVHTIQLPEVPDSLTIPSQRADYLAYHYWDALDFNDKAALCDSSMIEQSFVDFIDLLPHTTDEPQRLTAIDRLIVKSAANESALRQITDLASMYLYETESPMLNEELYQTFITSILSHEGLVSSADSLRYASLLNDIERNKPGTKIDDIRLETLTGEMQLSAAVAGKPSIIIIYDHDCDLCAETLSTMLDDSRITDKLTADKLSVIAIDVNDTPTTRKKEMSNWSWTSPLTDIDETIAFRSLPSLYVILPDLTVIIKDSSYQSVSSAIFH